MARWLIAQTGAAADAANSAGAQNGAGAAPGGRGLPVLSAAGIAETHRKRF